MNGAFFKAHIQGTHSPSATAARTPLRVLRFDMKNGQERFHIHQDDWDAHFEEHYQVQRRDGVPIADRMSKSLYEVNTTRANYFSKAAATDDPEYRWITVHPNGKDEKGVPIRIRKMHDGSWGVIGGAGGKLNGFRIEHVKSEHEYKQLAANKAAERRGAEAEKTHARITELHAKHLKIVHDENQGAAKPLKDTEMHDEAMRRALDQHTEELGERGKSVDELKDVKTEREKQLIAHIAQAQGWDEKDYTLTPDDIKAIRQNKWQQFIGDNPDLAKKAFENENVKEAKKASAKIDKEVDKITARVLEKHHKLVLKRALEAKNNHSEALLATVDGITADTLGDVGIGDLVKNTLGDAGKGYVAHIEDEARKNGVDPLQARVKAEDVNWDSRLERKDYDTGKAQKITDSIEMMQSKAAEARAEVRSVMDDLSEGEDSPIARVANLNTQPVKTDAGEAAKVVAGAKAIEANIKAVKQTIRDVKGGDPLDTLPNAAVLHSSEELTPEEAMEQVAHDLNETQRQRSVDSLLQLYNAQSEQGKLRSHVLAGHNAFLGNVAQILGLRAPDPLMADMLGESGAARLLARAVVQNYDKDKIEGIKNALQKEHIERQVKICDTAVENAKAKFEAAKNIDILPIEDVDSMFEGLDQNQKALKLHQQGREIVGLAVGRLQSAAALNDALGRIGSKSHDEDLHVSLGAISSADALQRAAAMGLTDLTQKNWENGAITKQGDFEIFNDGKNKILIVNSSGMDKLAERLNESPEHMERAAVTDAIKRGEHDEQGWLPQGFTDRPRSDVSRVDSPVADRLECQLDLSGIEAGKGALQARSAQDMIGDRIRRAIAQRIEVGQDPAHIGAELRSQAFIEAHVPAALRDLWHPAMNEVVPPFKATPGKRVAAGDYLQHQRMIDSAMRHYHAQFIGEEAKKMGLDPDTSGKFVSLHSQSLPQNKATADLIHQVNIQDPRLRTAFKPLADCERSESKMIRDYAYEHILKGPNGESLDPKNAEAPIEALSPNELKAFQKWNELRATGDPYGAIQSTWRDKTEADGGGMFDVQHHPLSQVNLQDQDAVYNAAIAHAKDLGFNIAHDGFDPKTGNFSRTYVEGLEASVQKNNETGEHVVTPFTDEQRERAKRTALNAVQKHLRDHAVNNLWGAGDGTKKGFDPEKVLTASKRWTEYVRDMGGEKRAYESIRDHMKGDFVSRLAKGYKQRIGQELRTAFVPVANADAHAYASLSPDKRKEQDSAASSEKDKLRNRVGGKYAEGSIKEGIEAKQQADLMGLALFDADEGKKAVEERGTHRVTIGKAAENMIGGMVPNLGLRQGTSAISDLNMSSGNAIKRQRAIKLIEANKRVQMSLGVGSGKTAISLGAFSHLKSQGKVKRSLMAVPSVVQEQFGSEAARFYDPTSKHFPKWFSDSGVSADARRAAYNENSGHDICVVTHQALRDDLTWAVAKHQFGGDEQKASEWLATAPEVERNEGVKQACQNEGWNFDMSVVDEGHNLLNRQGKANSAMANVIDAFTHDKEYHVPMSADPVKNDASEGFDLLRKVEPTRYVNDDHPLASAVDGQRKRGVITRSEFMRRYGVNTPAASEALAREMSNYHYAESLPPDTNVTKRTHIVPMTPPQQQAYNQVRAMYQRARQARLRKTVDVDAVRYLSPNSFKNVPPAQLEEVAQRLQDSLGILRDTALDRVVNLHPEGAKMDWLSHRLGIKHSKTMAELGIDPLPVNDHPKIVFAHNLAAVGAIEEHLKKHGIRTTRLDGTMTGEEKERAKLTFSPAWDDSKGDYVEKPEADVIVCSDAGAVGWNGQRADHVINYDTPHTAMTTEQRNGRSNRTGQRAKEVHLDTVMTDTNYEHARRERQEKKGDLRRTMTSPTELIDDSGLAARIARETGVDVSRAGRGVLPKNSGAPMNKSLDGVGELSSAVSDGISGIANMFTRKRKPLNVGAPTVKHSAPKAPGENASVEALHAHVEATRSHLNHIRSLYGHENDVRAQLAKHLPETIRPGSKQHEHYTDLLHRQHHLNEARTSYDVALHRHRKATGYFDDDEAAWRKMHMKKGLSLFQ